MDLNLHLRRAHHHRRTHVSNADRIFLPSIDLWFVMIELLDYIGCPWRTRIDLEVKVSLITRPKAPIVEYMYFNKLNVHLPFESIEFLFFPFPIAELVDDDHRMEIVVSGENGIKLCSVINHELHRRLRRRRTIRLDREWNTEGIHTWRVPADC